MESKYKYRAAIVNGFDPRDYQNHFWASEKKFIEDAPIEIWQEWYVKNIFKRGAENLFGTGALITIEFTRVENKNWHWCYKGWYYFNSIEFTDEQKEQQLIYSASYEIVPASEAEADAR